MNERELAWLQQRLDSTNNRIEHWEGVLFGIWSKLERLRDERAALLNDIERAGAGKPQALHSRR